VHPNLITAIKAAKKHLQKSLASREAELKKANFPTDLEALDVTEDELAANAYEIITIKLEADPEIKSDIFYNYEDGLWSGKIRNFTLQGAIDQETAYLKEAKARKDAILATPIATGLFIERAEYWDKIFISLDVTGPSTSNTIEYKANADPRKNGWSVRNLADSGTWPFTESDLETNYKYAQNFASFAVVANSLKEHGYNITPQDDDSYFVIEKDGHLLTLGYDKDTGKQTLHTKKVTILPISLNPTRSFELIDYALTVMAEVEEKRGAASSATGRPLVLADGEIHFNPWGPAGDFEITTPYPSSTFRGEMADVVNALNQIYQDS
jgi:hypothetical protein